MKITMESTVELVELPAGPARVWRGTTERGVEVLVLVKHVAVHRDDDAGKLERELTVSEPVAGAAPVAVDTLARVASEYTHEVRRRGRGGVQ